MNPGHETAAICGLFCGICHPARVIHDLSRMRETGVEARVSEQTGTHICPIRGKLVPWFERICPGCKT